MRDAKAMTIKDIARECGVSIATVSNVLNGRKKTKPETEEKIRAAVDKHGFKLNSSAKGLRNGRSGVIGVIVEDMAQFTTPDIVEGIMKYLEAKGYMVVLQNLRLYARWSDKWFDEEEMIRDAVDKAVNTLNALTVEGIIYVAVHYRETNKISNNVRVPAVMAYARELNPLVPSVVIDDEDGGYKAVKYLIKKGHEKIGILAGNEDNMHTKFRLEGAKRAMKEAGLVPDDSCIIYAGWSKALGYEGYKKLAHREITALFCMSDQTAGGVYAYFDENGLEVRRDLAIIGYDDKYFAEFFTPGLTSMRLPLEEIGETSAKLLLEKITAEPAGVRLSGNMVKIPCTMVVRESV